MPGSHDPRLNDPTVASAVSGVEATEGRGVSTSEPGGPWRHWKGDLAGGVTSGIVALPQTITIGALAFAPLGPEYVPAGILAGFYCSIISGALVALWGGTPFGLGGPRSSFSLVMALMIGALLAHESTLHGGLAALSPDGVVRILTLCFLAVAMAGLLQAVLGMLAIGSYIKFIPHPVVAGFMNGLAFLILVSQLPTLVGLGQRTDWWDLRAIWAGLQPETTAVALMTALVIWMVNRRWPKFPGAIAGVVVGTMFYYLLQALWQIAKLGPLDLGSVVGPIPAEWPHMETGRHIFEILGQRATWDAMWLVVPSILVLAILGALESLMCAVAVGQISGRRPSADRELIGQGFANVVGAGFGAVFGGSTSSRTVLNYRSGGRTRLSGLTHAGVMLLALMTARYWVAYLPHVVLSAVLAYIAVSLFDGWTGQIIKRLRSRNVHREVHVNFAIVILVTVATVAFNLVAGVLAGVVATVIVFIGKTSKTVVRALHRGNRRHSLKLRDPEQTAYLREKGARIVVVELEGTLFFGTADHLAEEVEQLATSADYFVFDCHRVTEFDATGAHILEQLGKRLAKLGKCALLSHVSRAEGHGEFLHDMGLPQAIPLEQWFADTDYALEWCENQLLETAFPVDVTQKELSVAQLGIAAGCDTDEIAVLTRHLERQSFEQGAYLFREGDAGDTMYMAARGSISIKLGRADQSGGKRLVTLSPGVMFGEMVLIESRPRSADAIAEEYSVVYGLPRAALDQMRREYPSLAGKVLFNISGLLADRLRTTTDELRAAIA